MNLALILNHINYKIFFINEKMTLQDTCIQMIAVANLA